MNLTLDLPDIYLSGIVERAIRQFFHQSELAESEAAKYLRRHIETQLREEIHKQLEAVNFEQEVSRFVESLLHSVIQTVVEKEIEKRAKIAVNALIINHELSR